LIYQIAGSIDAWCSREIKVSGNNRHNDKIWFDLEHPVLQRCCHLLNAIRGGSEIKDSNMDVFLLMIERILQHLRVGINGLGNAFAKGYRVPNQSNPIFMFGFW